ncbi:MAG: hypothetical protein AB7O45_08495 [Alphaproteobacteria bacterium]
MPRFYATYAGMLEYMAREFADLAKGDARHGDQLRRNAEILAHMAAEFDGASPSLAVARPRALFDHPV